MRLALKQEWWETVWGRADISVLIYILLWPWNPKRLALLHGSLLYASLFPQYLPHIHPILTHFVTNPAFVMFLDILLLCMKDKYGIYMHSLVLLMDLTPLHMTSLWRPHRETEQIIPLINVLYESEQIIQKSRILFWSLFNNNKYTAGMRALQVSEWEDML